MEMTSIGRSADDEIAEMMAETGTGTLGDQGMNVLVIGDIGAEKVVAKSEGTGHVRGA